MDLRDYYNIRQLYVGSRYRMKRIEVNYQRVWQHWLDSIYFVLNLHIHAIKFMV